MFSFLANHTVGVILKVSRCVCIRITDSAVKPLKAELAELEQLITEQQDKICAIKSNILQNEDKIHKIVSSINVSQT